jgi:serine/threonine protein kinase
MQESLIGKYKILDEIGRGGMGVVYRGEQVSLKRLVAIKTLPLELAHDHEYLERIEKEAEILAKFSHPCIVYIHELEKQADAVYLIMEYVPGITVAERIRDQGPYDVREAVRIIIRVASALDHAHKKGIIHRDIKPSNIMIREDNSVKVTDFGIAKSAEGSDITRLRWTPGTRDYMSPEQAQGSRDLDGRSDIYSLGIVFFLMITGKLPPHPLPARLPLVQPRYQKIILKCLAEDRSGRYPTANELIIDLEEAEGKRPGAVKTKKSGPSHPKSVAVMTCALVVVLVFGLFIWNLDHIENPITIVKPPLSGEEVAERKDQPPPSVSIPAKEDTQAAVTPQPVSPPAEDRFWSEPELRSASERTQEILNEVKIAKGMLDPGAIRRIFALKIGLSAKPGQPPGLLSLAKEYLGQLETVSSVDQGACDLLVAMGSNSPETTVTIVSNLFGDDQKDSYQEVFYVSDDQQLLSSLLSVTLRYYCFNILQAIGFLKPSGAFETALTIKGGSKGMFQVGENITICTTSKRKAYSVVLSAGAEGLYLLSPRTREEHVPLAVNKPACSEPLPVSPPTGVEMVAAIFFTDKSILPIDRYLASDDQVIVEPALWPYDMLIADNAAEYCEKLLTALQKADPDKWSVKSLPLKTYN